MDLSKLTPFHVLRYAISEEAGDDLLSTDIIMEDEIVAATLEELADKLAEVVRRIVSEWGYVSDDLKHEQNYGTMYLSRALVDQPNDTFTKKVAQHPASSYRFVEIIGYTIEMRLPNGDTVKAPYDDPENEHRSLFDRVIAARDEGLVIARAEHADGLVRKAAEQSDQVRARKRAEIARLQAELDAE